MMWLTLLFMNTVPVVCLTWLAIQFDKWWIVLFALLFSTSYKVTKKEGGKDEAH